MAAKVLSTTATPLSTAPQMAVKAQLVSPAALPAMTAPLKVVTMTASPLVVTNGVSVAATRPVMQISREALEAMAEAPLASAGLSSGTYSSERTLTREEMIKEGRIIQAPQQTWAAPLVITSSFVPPEAPPAIATPIRELATPVVAPEGILDPAETSDSVGNSPGEAEIFEPGAQVKEERAKGGFFGGFAAWVQGICKVAPQAAAAPTGVPIDQIVEVQPVVEMAAPILTVPEAPVVSAPEVITVAPIAAVPEVKMVVHDEAPVGAAPEVTAVVENEAPVVAAPAVTTRVCNEAPIAAAPAVTTVVRNEVTTPVVSPSMVVVPSTSAAAISPAWTRGEIEKSTSNDQVVKAIDVAQVVTGIDVAQVQSVEKILQVPQVQSVDEIVETPEPQIQEMAKTMQVPPIREVLKEIQDPQVQQVDKPITDPEAEVVEEEVESVEKILQVPQIQSADETAETPETPIQEVLMNVQIPQLQQAEQPIADPQSQAFEKEVIVPIPRIQEDEAIVKAVPAVAIVPQGVEQVKRRTDGATAELAAKLDKINDKIRNAPGSTFGCLEASPPGKDRMMSESPAKLR